jgi:hypothetical protein
MKQVVTLLLLLAAATTLSAFGRVVVCEFAYSEG